MLLMSGYSFDVEFRVLLASFGCGWIDPDRLRSQTEDAFRRNIIPIADKECKAFNIETTSQAFSSTCQNSCQQSAFFLSKNDMICHKRQHIHIFTYG